ncbi:selenide, water dikinase SelD [Meridianimarinicoccus sp. MJW13]|uniref:selenide, water dikinase SelD n=1 Tax=Meridianimarinicoccus sp. MJW13 TaxID=2720031 RepID=UPI001868DE47|nr:selenide, water dikinase SelD [Fluviibacterium sp. MJW13]
MMTPPLPLTRDLVLVGGGHTHALVLRKWGMAPVAGVRLTLINPGPTAPYSGMLPGHVAGHYNRADLDIDLVRLARFAGARLILDAATGIDRDAQEVHVAGRAPVAYDLVSVGVGITSDMPVLPGFAEHCVPAKPLGPFARRWAAFVEQTETTGTPARVAIIGAGVAGVELALAMAHRLHAAGVAAPEVTLVEAAAPLALLRPRAQALLLDRLTDAGIALRDNCRITHVTEGALHLDDGGPIPFDFCVGTAGTRPHPWIAGTGLELTDGFINVGPDLRSLSDPLIYAVGDCAHLTHAPRPKAGVFAVREAPILYDNLKADLTGQSRRRTYAPQRDYLKLISLGGKDALVEKGPVTLAAPWLWRLKNKIDQDFMEKFRTLPAMEIPPLPRVTAAGVREAVQSRPPLCGGCGAKVGPATLAQALARLPETGRKDLTSRPGDDAAILDLGEGRFQVLTTDHLRAVLPDPWRMAQITALHALGDIWAMGAAPQVALASLTLPAMRDEMQARTLSEITEAASAVFRAAGADLAGGHTTQGAELSLGFTVTGICDRPPIELSGAQPGDALILTRALGSGTLLAAEMRGLAAGADMAALYATLVRSQADAAALLAPLAHAMTDVTGFGLAGHALAMARASGVGLTLDPAGPALYTGAEALAAGGVRSSLFTANRDHALPSMEGFGDGPRSALLFDPQTCGGFLAAVPAEAAAGAVDRLQAMGHAARQIGSVGIAPAGIIRAAR